MSRNLVIIGICIFSFCSTLSLAADNWVMPRAANGKPDLQGIWTNATQTPLQRPTEFGNTGFLTLDQKEGQEAQWRQRISDRAQPSDPNRPAPPASNNNNPGGYNNFWVDRGTNVIEINGEYRTSIIVDPENGRIPYHEDWRGKNLLAQMRAIPGVNNFDGPELRPLGERCLLAFGSSSGPPMMPVLYNNNYQIVQTEDYVMIMVEMVHDTRIIRIDGEHRIDFAKWMGDSIGYWEGDTLVVETIGLHPMQSRWGFTGNVKVTERFDLIEQDKVRYHFTVEDDEVYTRPWSGEVAMNRRPEDSDQIYEYACHEGNYAFPGILGGARRLEAENAPK